MTIAQLFAKVRAFLKPDVIIVTIKQGAKVFDPRIAAVEHEASVLLTEAKNVVHQAEKELEMIPQPIQDLISQIAAALSSHSNQSAADAATISGLSAQCSDLTVQVRDKESQIGALTQQVSDLTGEVNDIQAALAAALAAAPAPAPAPVGDPAPAPADGSASADPTP